MDTRMEEDKGKKKGRDYGSEGKGYGSFYRWLNFLPSQERKIMMDKLCFLEDKIKRLEERMEKN